jgi:hypothetical protein
MDHGYVYRYSKSLIDYSRNDLNFAKSLLNSQIEDLKNNEDSSLLFSIYFLHQSLEKNAKAYMTLIIAMLLWTAEELSSKNDSTLKKIFLDMYVKRHLTNLFEENSPKLTDLSEIFKKQIGHDETEILSFLNGLNEDVSSHGKLTILLEETGMVSSRNGQSDLFKILESMFDPSNRECQGYKDFNLNDNIMKNIRDALTAFKDILNRLLELLNDVQGYTRIPIDNGPNRKSDSKPKEAHINEAARYPIQTQEHIYKWPDIIQKLPDNDKNNIRENLQNLINDGKETITKVENLLESIKREFPTYKDIFTQLLQKIISS